MRLSNDNAALDARTDFDGPVLELDFPGLRIGVAEYEEGPTGCTVFHFVNGATCATRSWMRRCLSLLRCRPTGR